MSASHESDDGWDMQVTVQFTKQMLNTMSVEQLLALQRAVLTPEEQKMFDEFEPFFLEPDDCRMAFFDYTDMRLMALDYDPEPAKQAYLEKKSQLEKQRQEESLIEKYC